MDLPELRLAVARHLSKNDLFACALVCKQWHATFQGCLWSVFELRLPLSLVHSPCTFPVCRTHVRCILKFYAAKNAHHIRHLVLPNQKMASRTEEFYTIFAKQCRQLKSVSLHDCSGNWEEPIKQLFAVNRALQHLSTNAAACLNQVFVLSRLKTLDVNIALSVSDILMVMDECHSLEDMTLRQPFSPIPVLSAPERPSSRSASSPPFRLKRLSILQARLDHSLGMILTRCSLLNHIQLHQLLVPDMAAAKAMLQGNVQRLQSIDLLVYDASLIHHVLKAVSHNPLQSMTIHYATYNTYRTIARLYGKTLVHLVLHLNMSCVDSLVHIFSGCQGLKTLQVRVEQSRYVDLRHLIGQPWACHQLESLSIPLALLRQCNNDALLQAASFEKAELAPLGKMPEWLRAENVFMRRLGVLVRLRRLYLVAFTKGNAATRPGMSWRLEGGLGLLAGLSCLETLHLGHGRYLQGPRELEWMKGHWPRLVRLSVNRMETLQNRRWFAQQWPDLIVIELADDKV